MNSFQGHFLVAASPQPDPNFVKAALPLDGHNDRGAFSGLRSETCGMWRIIRLDSALSVEKQESSSQCGAGSKGEETVAKKQTSGALHNDRLTSQVSAAAPRGPPHAEGAAAMAPQQWTLPFLIAVLKKSNQKRSSS
jgi:hypothetical protein